MSTHYNCRCAVICALIRMPHFDPVIDPHQRYPTMTHNTIHGNALNSMLSIGYDIPVGVLVDPSNGITIKPEWIVSVSMKFNGEEIPFVRVGHDGAPLKSSLNEICVDVMKERDGLQRLNEKQFLTIQDRDNTISDLEKKIECLETVSKLHEELVSRNAVRGDDLRRANADVHSLRNRNDALVARIAQDADLIKEYLKRNAELSKDLEAAKQPVSFVVTSDVRGHVETAFGVGGIYGVYGMSSSRSTEGAAPTGLRNKLLKGFVTAESCGPDNHYQLVVKFPTLEALQSAHNELVKPA